jgi:hypothetical protein
MNCAEAYEYIVEAMAEFDPEISKSLNPRTLSQDGKELVDYEPNLPTNVKDHISHCKRCEVIAELLKGKMIKRGEVLITSQIKEPGEDTVPSFKGTPKIIIDSMTTYYSQVIKDQEDLIEKRIKFCNKIVGRYGTEGLEMDDNNNIKDIDFLKFCLKHRVITIGADPWFIITEKPSFLMKKL